MDVYGDVALHGAAFDQTMYSVLSQLLPRGPTRTRARKSGSLIRVVYGWGVLPVIVREERGPTG